MQHILTLKEYSKACGLTTATILKRIHKGHIKPGIDIIAERLTITIDTTEFPIEGQKGEKRGRPKKA